MSDIAIKIENLKKQYKLGAIGGRTLNAELQSWWARRTGKEDPNLKIGQSADNYGETFLALDGINLEAKKGEAIGIIGGNGAGKSTLLKILSRVTAPTEGDVWINGRVASMLEVGTGFHGELTGRENIYMNGAILGMTKKEVDSKIESIIDFSECREFIDTPVKRYSSGMYVKLAFAVASHLDAEIMIMDEVLAVGDMKFQKKCLGKMGDEAADGKTILYVSHNMATIRNLCSRSIVLNKGKVIFDGDVETAISKYLDIDEDNLKDIYFLNDEERAVHNFGNVFHLEKVDFRKKKPIYSSKESMKFSVSFSCCEFYTDLIIFIQIYNAKTGIPVTLMTSERIITNENEVNLEADISMLSESFYYFEIGAMRLLPDGTHITLDRTKTRVYFQINREDMRGFPIWSNSVYGSVVVPHMRRV